MTNYNPQQQFGAPNGQNFNAPYPTPQQNQFGGQQAHPAQQEAPGYGQQSQFPQPSQPQFPQSGYGQEQQSHFQQPVQQETPAQSYGQGQPFQQPAQPQFPQPAYGQEQQPQFPQPAYGQEQQSQFPQPAYGQEQQPQFQQPGYSQQSGAYQYGGQAPQFANQGQYPGNYGHWAPRPAVGFMQAIKLFFKNYAKFNGRANRGEYWYAYLGLMLMCIPFGVIQALLALNKETQTFAFIPVLLFELAIILPSLAVSVRRLHDTGRSGWCILLSLIPFGIGSLILLVFTVGESKPEGARFDIQQSQPYGIESL